ncbi:hypothetical protein CMO90_01700 [Candidatus Woesearchaeota archaeon]|jgi:hypothetical protein|nr:hypothetical protein [Candidatus Woesearchaeota archaeon]|tara:strand:- start:23 stop:343 length:321 start_codon:yes stop_codon:yes gene_type:complete
MELTDLLFDVDAKHTAVIYCSGALTGVVAGYFNLKDRVKNGREKLFSKDEKIEYEIVKNTIVFTNAVGATDFLYGNTVSNSVEFMTYFIASKVGLEIGLKVYEYAK